MNSSVINDQLAPARRSGLRRFVTIVFITSGLICAVWTGLWFVAASTTRNAIEGWFADEKLAGRNWVCADTSVKGFPLRIDFHCGQPRLSATINSVAMSGGLGDIVAGADVYRPGRISAKLQSPLELRSQDGTVSLQLAWRDGDVLVEIRDDTLNRLSLTLAQARGALALRNRDPLVVDVSQFRFNLGHQSGATEKPRPIELQMEALNIRSSDLDRLGESQALAQVRLVGRVLNADLAAAASWAHALELWRLSQGSLEIDQAGFSKGALSVNGQGKLSLDALRRLQGSVTIDAANVTSIAQKLGIPASAFAIGDFLSGFLGGQQQQARPAEAKPTRVSLRLENGRVMLGPVPLPLVLLPLY